MLLALWPLFISTNVALPQQDISQLVTQYNESKYERAIKHEISLSASTSQVQSLSARFCTSEPDVEAVELVSAYYHLNVATEQVQDIRGTISAKDAELTPIISAILSDEPIQIADKHIGLYASSVQSQHVVGKIELSEQTSVSTHSLSNSITAQIQEISGKIVAIHRHISISAAISEQQQAISGRITTNDDDEMLMVLMALLELDNEIT